MANKDESKQSVNGAVNSDFDWGAKAIGKTIGRTPRQTLNLLATGQIKCALRKGGFWVANRAKLRAEFGG